MLDGVSVVESPADS